MAKHTYVESYTTIGKDTVSIEIIDGTPCLTVLDTASCYFTKIPLDVVDLRSIEDMCFRARGYATTPRAARIGNGTVH